MSAQEVAALDDTDMETIANRMSDAYRDSGGYWDSLEIMARFVLDRKQAALTEPAQPSMNPQSDMSEQDTNTPS